MDRQSKIVIGFYASMIFWAVAIVMAMVGANFGLVGIAGLWLGVWQIRFRDELAFHYRTSRRLQSGMRGTYGKPWSHRILGFWFCFVSLFFLLQGILQLIRQ